MDAFSGGGPHGGLSPSGRIQAYSWKARFRSEPCQKNYTSIAGNGSKDNGHIQETDALSLIDEILTLAYPKAQEKGVQIHLCEKRSTVEFWSDPHRLKQILLNLSNNAIDATPREGKISLDFKK